jgi:hypothetical protein
LTNANQSNIYKTLTQSIQDNGKSYKELMNDITTFILMLTAYLPDPVLSVSTEGEILRTMNIRDGYANESSSRKRI